MRTAVLPGAEPQQNEMYFVLARLRQQSVHHRVVEMSLLGFELLPVDGDLKRVGVQRFNRRPHLAQRCGPRAGVVGLRAEDQVGCAVYEECVAAVLLDDVWKIAGGLRTDVSGATENYGNEDKTKSCKQHATTYAHE